MKYVYTFILSLFLINFSFAQKDINPFEKVSIGIEGEEIYDVFNIIQDHQGYIWLVTNLGLIRFDGIEGKKYEFMNNHSSSSINNHIHSLFVDHLGDIWIGSRYGLSKYNPDCDCMHQYPLNIEDIHLKEIRSITEDNNKNIWIGTLNGELYRYERKLDQFTQFLNTSSDPITIKNNGIYHLLLDQNDNLWIGTDSNKSKNELGLIRYNLTTGNVKQFLHNPSNPNSLLNNRISALYKDQQGQILIGTYNSGFHIYDSKSDSVKRVSIDANNHNLIHAPYTEDKIFDKYPDVHIIHQDRNEGYWIGTRGKGVNYFKSGTKEYKNFDFNLVNPQVLSTLFEDRQGNIWIGGNMGSGLFRTDLFAQKHNLNTNFLNVEGAFESSFKPGIIWVPSMKQGLAKLNLKTNKITNYVHDKNNIKSIGHNWVRSTYQENKRILWLGLGTGSAYGNQDGNGGISRLDIETETFINYKLIRNDDKKGDFSYTVYSICEDKEGHLWLGTGPGGIFRSDKEKKVFHHFNILKKDSISDDFFNIARIDKNGNIWASNFSDNGTLYLYDRKENKFNPYLKGFKMYNLSIDDKGWILISTYENGLVHLNPADRTYTHYTKKDGLLSNEGLDIVKGENNIFWINTRLGPVKFDANNGEFTTAGLPKKRYNTTIFKASDDQIYVGSDNGLYSFYPDHIHGNPYPPQVAISELLISEKNYLVNKTELNELNLSYNQNDISFKYTALHYSNPEKNSYQYKLSPLNNEWINVESDRIARFFNLLPGTYDFQVKASNSDGVWSDEIASVQFTIKSPWWATWWAYLIYACMFAFIIYKIYRFQLSRKIADSERKRLKEINQLKNALFTNITHEFRTPLTVIKGMTDTIKSNLKSKELDNLDTSLEMIERNSNNLLQLVNEMLGLAKLESGKMELQLVQSDVIPLLKYLSESFSSFAEENQISLTIYSEIDSLIMDFDGNKLTSVISNLLSNAIKFTPEYGKIIVHLNQITQKDESYLFIKVKDTGIGIPNEELPNIFNRFYQLDASTIRKHEGTGIGLALTKELVELMNGTIEAKSTLNKGSEFSVMIPIMRKSPKTSKVEIDTISTTPVVNISSNRIEQTLETNSELPLVLIVEDNMDVAHYLKTCLTNKYETIHAINGIEGIEMAFENIPDIIICDIMMPGKNGYEVCATLKTDERSDHIPIIILTAKVSTEDRLTGLSHGADAYLAKPFNKEELFTRLDQLLSLRKKLVNKIQNDGFNTILKKRTNNPKLQFLKKIVKLIHEDIGNSNFGSGDLAKKLLISESQLYRKIKAITEKSTAIFIRSIRLQYAKKLLTTTNKTVSEIAYEVGFNDPSWFSRSFKDEFGFSPSAASK